MTKSIKDDRIKIRVIHDTPTYWYWCRENLELGTWDKLIGMTASVSSTYRFDNEEDATAFKLKFGV